jgi:hypothetical protein
MLKNQRIIIYAKDICLITGCCERSAYALLNEIRKKNGKTQGQAVTVCEFCEHLGLDRDMIVQMIN